MTDFSTPRRMSASAFVVMAVKSFKELSGAVLIGFIYLMFRGDDDHSSFHVLLKIAICVGALAALSVTVAFSKYYFQKFHIENDKLIFTHGFASKQTKNIPLSRIHTLRTKRGLFYRIFDLRGVTFDTLASDKQEVELILDESDWQNLLRRVSDGEDIAEHSSRTVPPPIFSKADIKRISNFNIIKGALCQNHLKGFALLATVAAAVFDKVNQFDNDTVLSIGEYIDSHAGDILPTAWQWFFFLIGVYLFVMILWTGKITLRYGNMVISTAGRLVTVESGLVSRFTCRLARERVTILSIKRNPIERLAGCQTVTLRQAENASDAKKEGGIRIYGSQLGGSMLKWWLADDRYAGDVALLSAKSGSGLIVRKFIPSLILTTAIAIVSIHFAVNMAATVAVCAAITVVAAARAAMAWRHSRISLYNSYIKIDCGNIAQIQKYIKYRDVESVGIRHTPFTPFTRRVSLQITTNAEAITVSSLSLDSAFRLRNVILNKTI